MKNYTLIRMMFAVTALLLVCPQAWAEMYQWVDEKGVVTFKDSPPPASKKGKKVKAYSDSDFDPAPPSQPAPPPTTGKTGKSPATTSSQAPAPKSERFQGTVEMFVTDWCGYCRKARQYMDANGIPYVTYDIEKDSAAKQRFQELGGGGVPLILIGSKKISGFSPEAVEYYLRLSK